MVDGSGAVEERGIGGEPADHAASRIDGVEGVPRVVARRPERAQEIAAVGVAGGCPHDRYRARVEDRVERVRMGGLIPGALGGAPGRPGVRLVVAPGHGPSSPAHARYADASRL